MASRICLQVNGIDINFERFVDSFIEHTVCGMLASLDGTGPVKDLDLTLDGDDIRIILNGEAVVVNTFVRKIMKSTFFGMVSPLKGVNIKSAGELRSLQLKISR
jgi:hypothetical protein